MKLRQFWSHVSVALGFSLMHCSRMKPYKKSNNNPAVFPKLSYKCHHSTFLDTSFLYCTILETRRSTLSWLLSNFTLLRYPSTAFALS